ncbi:MAG: hypothetical protein NTW11_00440 [Candidatus Staskawiczbacteria bacterium]|nr:hypothetical protein [Candidatus Staskawiczbacteria bacterium]
MAHSQLAEEFHMNIVGFCADWFMILAGVAFAVLIVWSLGPIRFRGGISINNESIRTMMPTLCVMAIPVAMCLLSVAVGIADFSFRVRIHNGQTYAAQVVTYNERYDTVILKDDMGRKVRSYIVPRGKMDGATRVDERIFLNHGV